MKIIKSFKRVDPELVEAYKRIAPATLGHKTNLRFMDSGIKPVFSDVKLVGSAFTVWAPGVDVSALTWVDQLAQPGDVVVVDQGGDLNHACIGEFRALKHIRLGLAGWVIDGATTDTLEIQKMRFPVFCRSVSALVGKMLESEGSVCTPINCGGVVVYPGDLIVADDNGIVVLSEEEAKENLAYCQQAEEREKKLRAEYIEEYRKLLP